MRVVKRDSQAMVMEIVERQRRPHYVDEVACMILHPKRCRSRKVSSSVAREQRVAWSVVRSTWTVLHGTTRTRRYVGEAWWKGVQSMEAGRRTASRCMRLDCGTRNCRSIPSLESLGHSGSKAHRIPFGRLENGAWARAVVLA